MTPEVLSLIESSIKFVSLIAGTTIALVTAINKVAGYFELKLREGSLGETRVKEMEAFRVKILSEISELKEDQDKLSEHIYKTLFKRD